jgi:myo-inositol-1(or 4)-monophosphatase
MHPMVNIAEKAARSAGNLILKASERMDKVKVIPKGPGDFVTEVDMMAEKEIIQILQSTYPDHAIIAEESGQTAQTNESVWIIDPLDGTTNFIHGFPHYAVSIAYQYRGKIEHGVIYDPIRDELFSASRGRGAKLNNTRLRVSPCTRLEQSLVGTGFPVKYQDEQPLYLRLFDRIFPKTAGVRRAGSAALDLAYVAAGRLDAFWEMKLKLWDFAAGILLIKEAGGLVGDFQGSDNYLSSGNIVAGNSKLFKALVQEISAELSAKAE